MTTKNTKSFYVYGLFEEGVCFYIGKGTNNRYKDHFNQYRRNYKMQNYMLWCKLKALESRNVVPVASILKESLTEEEAYELEKYYICKYKKKTEGGTLCNITDGGDQPPTRSTLIQTRSAEEFEKITLKQRKTFKQTILERNKHKVDYAKQLMAEGKMVKDIAAKLKVSAITIRAWFKQAGIPINYDGKKNYLKTHFIKLRQDNKLKIPKTAKTYKVLTPENELITTQRLVTFCKERKIDYSGLRQTYNGRLKQCKGYSIVEVIEPSS